MRNQPLRIGLSALFVLVCFQACSPPDVRTVKAGDAAVTASSSGESPAPSAAPAERDRIVEIIEEAITAVATGERRFDEGWGATRAALMEAAEVEELGAEDILESAVRSLTEVIIEQGMDRPEAAPGPLDASRRLAVASLSRSLAASFRASMKSGGLHTGILTLTPSFDVPDGYEKASWELLGGFEFVDRKPLPDEVMRLDERRVGVAGYMMSMGEYDDVRNFLLVESQWSCCFGLPPEANQSIVCQIPHDHPATEMTNAAVRVLGTLEVGAEREDGYVVSLYRLVVERVDVLE